MMVASGVYISFIFIDTSPCVKEYRSESKAGWDPCGSEYPTCSLTSDPDDQFEGPCEFHSQILEQDCGAQFAWFKKALANVDKNDWLIVVGHHPADEIDVEDFTTALQQRGIDLYLNGHAHTLTHYTIDGGGYYVTTGAGAMVPTEDQTTHTPGKNRTHSKVLGLDLPAYNGHSYKVVWNGRVAGFTRHTFNSDFSQLTTDYITYKGDIVHSFNQTKGGGGGDSCCHYNDTSCSVGQICCKSGCNDPSTCSYTQSGCTGKYGEIHHCQWTDAHCVVGSSLA